MNNMDFDDDFDARREKRRARMRTRKRRQAQQRKMIIATVLAVVALVVLVVVVNIFGEKPDNDDNKQASSQNVEAGKDKSNKDKEDVAQDKEQAEDKEQEQRPPYYADITQDTTDEFPDVTCEYAVLIDKDEHKIVAQRNYNERMNPASMTKVLTVLVAAENVENLDDVCTVTLETTDYCFTNDCSNAGYLVGEKVTVKELFYGTILPSGADAALTLADYVAGSHEAFVDKMNDKLKELKLSETTHFTNCVGLYDENHYTTAYDMAIILEAAMENELCREVLSAHIHASEKTKEHPDGQSLSNLFLRRVEDQELGDVVVLGAKTGYVLQAGNCCVSCAVAADGKEYYLCTAKSSGGWPCIYDHAKIYKKFVASDSQS